MIISIDMDCLYCCFHELKELNMGKGKDVKKPERKKAQKTLKEKRQEKKDKKNNTGILDTK